MAQMLREQTGMERIIPLLTDILARLCRLRKETHMSVSKDFNSRSVRPRSGIKGGYWEPGSISKKCWMPKADL